MSSENKPPKIDRRIKRTRHLLRDALMRLVQTKSYDEITIQDITDEADIARTTFYLHFKDKDGLLFDMMREMYDLLTLEVDGLPPDVFLASNEEDCYSEDFKHVLEYADFYRVMLSGQGSPVFLFQVQDYLAMVMQKSLEKLIQPEMNLQMPIDYMASLIAGAHIGVIRWWLNNHTDEYTPEKMALMTQQTLQNGLIWVVGQQ